MAKSMGMHNRITEKRYNAAKAELKSPKDDKRVMRKYGFGATTARNIRNTDNFYEFRQKGTTGRRQREHLENTLADLREERLQTKLEYLEYEDSSADRIVGFIIAMMVFILLIVGGIIFLIVRGS